MVSGQIVMIWLGNSCVGGIGGGFCACRIRTGTWIRRVLLSSRCLYSDIWVFPPADGISAVRASNK